MKFKSKYIAIFVFAMIPLSVLAYYGMEDKNADYFAKGRFITNTEGWQYRYNGLIYHLGVMVSHWALIGIVSIVFILIAWIGYEGLHIVMVRK